jgi:hypothetical protein
MEKNKIIEATNIVEKEIDIFKEIKQQAINSIKYGEELLRKFSRKQGLDEDDIKYIDMTFLGKNDIAECIKYIKSKVNKPKEPIEIIKMIDKDGLTEKTKSEIKKYLDTIK